MSLLGAAAVSGGLSLASNLTGTMLSNYYARGAESREREYNDPSAQMERYRRAGLNPNLIYGQISNGNIAARSSPAHFDNPAAAAAEGIQGYANARLLKGQLEGQELENKNKASENKVIEANARRTAAEATVSEHDANKIPKRPSATRGSSIEKAYDTVHHLLSDYGNVQMGFKNFRLRDQFKSNLNPSEKLRMEEKFNQMLKGVK